MTGFILNMTVFFLNMTRLVLNMTELDDHELNGMAYITV